ncbi:hypothetical protein [Alkalibacter mobilis]|uniref:hypothetical protein n=1 Tax=Alkalibacter mobilis TaxID=2787712 RepID=UPI00189FF7CF|nr:hypothetical protein [Alkalibacter mobilis]MBF7095731.1 hypothetical protein [Alkalibacter mobilis]
MVYSIGYLENQYLEEMFSLVKAGIMDILEVFLEAENELKSIPYFSRSKLTKDMEKILGSNIHEISNQFFELKILIEKIEANLKSRKFIEMEQNLQTYIYSYMPTIEKSLALSEYYKNIPAKMEKYLIKKGSLEATKETYEKRVEKFSVLYQNLIGLYKTISLEDIYI